jgi:glycosyltransferase involved in cell wall biosynthesis
MSAQPFFSIGLPTYNRAAMLRTVLPTLLQQTFNDFEIIIADNASTDDTTQVVTQFPDPRIRYVRHEKNIGPFPNFNFLCAEAKGKFFVLHQDDDFLHRDFLQRAHQQLSLHPRAVFYGCVPWRGHPATGFRTDLMLDPINQDTNYMVQDQPLVLNGNRFATHFLHCVYVAHPGVVLRTDLIPKIGGYFSDPINNSDIITQARILGHGEAIYDPRPGCVYVVHATNASRIYPKSEKVAVQHRTYHQLITDFEARGFDWTPVFRADLERYPHAELLRLFGLYVRYNAPWPMQQITWELVRKKSNRHGLRFWRRLISRVGFSNVLTFLQRAQRNRLTP